MDAALVLALLLSGSIPAVSSPFVRCKPFVQGPLELDAHAGGAGWSFGELGLLFGVATVGDGVCESMRPRCELVAFTDASLPPGWTSYLNLGTFYPGLQLQPIPFGATVWPFDLVCGKQTFIQAYIFDGPPGLLTTSLVAMEQVTAGCGVCPGS